MSDRVIPHFHSLRKKGGIFFNPMLRTETIGERLSGNGWTVENKAGFSCSGITRKTQSRDLGNQVENLYSVAIGQALDAGRLPPIFDLHGSDVSAALTECSTKVQSDRGRSDSNLWEALAESDKALGTLTGIFKSAYRTMKARNLRDFTLNSSSGYLGWRYGIKPMISDVNAVIDGLEKKVGRMRKTTRAKVSLTGYRQRTVIYNGNPVVEIGEACYDDVEIRGMSLDEHVLTRANAIGFSSKGLITLPWELVKRSFVLDWFLTMGDFIGALTPAFGWTQLGSCYTIKRGQRTVIAPTRTNDSSTLIVLSPVSGGYTLFRNTRQRVIGLPAPGVVVRSDFRFSNLTRAADALSLLAQQVFNKR